MHRRRLAAAIAALCVLAACKNPADDPARLWKGNLPTDATSGRPQPPAPRASAATQA